MHEQNEATSFHLLDSWSMWNIAAEWLILSSPIADLQQAVPVTSVMAVQLSVVLKFQVIKSTKKTQNTQFLCVWKRWADVCNDLPAWDNIHRNIKAILVIMRQLEEIIQCRLRGGKVVFFWEDLTQRTGSPANPWLFQSCLKKITRITKCACLCMILSQVGSHTWDHALCVVCGEASLSKVWLFGIMQETPNHS